MQRLVSPVTNPAYTGLDGIYDLVLLTRQQWVGFEGAPKSFLMATNVPLPNKRTGIGFDIQYQSSGPFTQTGFFLNYSYSISITEVSTLSFGLRGGINSYQIMFNDLRLIDAGDYLFETDVRNLILPNFGTGVHYTAGNYFVDLSIPMLLRNEFSPQRSDKVGKQNREDRIYIIQTGAEFPLLEGFTLQPAGAVWFTKGAPPLVDIRLSATIQDALGFGVAYRVAGSLSAYVSYRVLDNFLLCYAYELPLTYDYHLNSGTHEVVLGYDFQLFKTKTLSPRRF